MRRWLAAAVILSVALTACGCKDAGKVLTAEDGVTEFSFSSSVDYDTIQSLNGKRVRLVGYMATLSPISGKYMYLMNMPYQSCPFCLPNTQTLSNTMAVYAPEGKRFDFTDQAIRVTGTLETGRFLDEYSYEYNYRIADATYEIVDLSELSDSYALWYAIAGDGIVADVNSLFDFVFFLCQWPDYTGYYVDENGDRQEFYFYPGDVEQCLSGVGMADYSMYVAEGYYDGLLRRVRAISETELTDLEEIIKSIEPLADRALAELNSGAYTYDEAADRFTLNEQEALYNAFYDVFTPFSLWLARWEM